MRDLSATNLTARQRAPTGNPYVRATVANIIKSGGGQCLISGYAESPSVSATNYSGIYPGSQWSVNEDLWSDAAVQTIPTSGFISNLRVYLPTAAPGAGKSLTFTVRKNKADTDLTCTISGTDTAGVDTVHSIEFAAGDKISISCTPSNTPTSPGHVKWSVVWTPIVFDEYILLTGGDISNAGINTYTSLHFATNAVTNTLVYEARSHSLAPVAGTIKSMYVYVTAAPGSGKNVKFTLRRNGVNTNLTCTIAGADTTGNDTTHSVAVTAGDKFTIEIDPTATLDTWMLCAIGLVFVPTASTNASIITGLIDDPHVITTEYTVLNPSYTGTPLFTSSEAARKQVVNACTLGNLRIALEQAPGAGNSYTFTLRKNGADTDLTVTIANADTTGADTTHTVSFSDGDFVCLQCEPSSIPLETSVWWGIATGTAYAETFDTYDHILAVKQFEGTFDDGAYITLDNSNGYFSSKKLQGSKIELGFGFDGEYSNVPDLYVYKQADISYQGKLFTLLYCEGNWGRHIKHKIMGDSIATGYATGTDTVKTIIETALLSGSSLTVDSSDGREDTVIPDWTYDVTASRWGIIRDAISVTGNLLRWRGSDLHMIERDDTATADYTYDLGGTHPFFNFTRVQADMVANRVICVDVLPDTASTNYTYIGQADDTADQAIRGVVTMVWADPTVTSNAEAASVAADILVHVSAETQGGLLKAPMHCGQEVYDLISIVDSRAGWTGANAIKLRVGMITREYNPSAGEYSITLGFGGLAWERPEPVPVEELLPEELLPIEEREDGLRWSGDITPPTGGRGEPFTLKYPSTIPQALIMGPWNATMNMLLNTAGFRNSLQSQLFRQAATMGYGPAAGGWAEGGIFGQLEPDAESVTPEMWQAWPRDPSGTPMPLSHEELAELRGSIEIEPFEEPSGSWGGEAPQGYRPSTHTWEDGLEW